MLIFYHKRWYNATFKMNFISKIHFSLTVGIPLTVLNFQIRFVWFSNYKDSTIANVQPFSCLQFPLLPQA